jgi:hypothetical protein
MMPATRTAEQISHDHEDFSTPWSSKPFMIMKDSHTRSDELDLWGRSSQSGGVGVTGAVAGVNLP